MDDILQTANQLQNEVQAAATRLDIDSLKEQNAQLQAQTVRPDFWDNPTKAQAISKQQSKLETRLTPWLELQTAIHEIIELANLQDVSIYDDLQAQLSVAAEKFEKLKDNLKLAGPHDDDDAIVNIYVNFMSDSFGRYIPNIACLCNQYICSIKRRFTQK